MANTGNKEQIDRAAESVKKVADEMTRAGSDIARNGADTARQGMELGLNTAGQGDGIRPEQHCADHPPRH